MTRPTSPFPPPSRSATTAYGTLRARRGRRRRDPRGRRPRRPGRGVRGTRRAPVVTRAALDPALVAGRGADVPFLEQEAENAVTNGTVIGPDRTAYTLPAEASGRTRGASSTPGQYVEFTLPAAANAITVRYSIPDAPDRRRHHRAARRHASTAAPPTR